MSQRTLVIGDIHGGLKALQQVLERVSVTDADQLIFLGDYVDGWSESPQLIDFLINLNTSHQCIFLRGNHDDLVLSWLQEGTKSEEWLIHGGKSTLAAYEDISTAVKGEHIGFLEALKPYYLDDDNRLFLHAGFTHFRGVEKERHQETFCWDRSLWEMVLALNPELTVDDDFYPRRLKLYREIFIGHTPTTRFSKTLPMNFANVWNLDTGAAFTGPLTMMDAETKQFWQSDNLIELYSDEVGRN